MSYYVGIDPAYVSKKNAIVIIDSAKKVVLYTTLNAIKKDNKITVPEYINQLYTEITTFLEKNIQYFNTNTIVGIEESYYRFNVKTLIKLQISKILWSLGILTKTTVNPKNLFYVYPAQWKKYSISRYANADLNSALGIALYCLNKLE